MKLSKVAPPPAPGPNGPTWAERLMMRIMGLAPMKEVDERMRGYRGHIARLTPQQIAAIDAYDGPEVFGSPEQVHKY